MMKLAMDENTPERTLLNAPYVGDASKITTPYAFLSIPYGPPYHAHDLTACAGGADAIRNESYRRSAYALNWGHYDFDLGEALFPDDVCTISDCGQVPTDVRNPDDIWDVSVEIVQKIVRAGAVPLVVGGFDSIPPIVAEALEGEGINVLHIDSHLDFREERYGVRRGYSSPIRRIRELPWVQRIVQVGLRGAGSARESDVREAVESGNELVTAWELHESGPESLLERLAGPGRWLITIDCDGLDVSIAPAVSAREPGGLTFHEIRTLVAGLADKNKVAALVFTEFQPERDIQEITAHTILRLIINVVGRQRAPIREVGTRFFRAQGLG